MKNLTYAVIGGDLRSTNLANLLIAEGKKVNVFGFENSKINIHSKESKDLCSAIKDTDIIIAPLPFSKDKSSIYAPFHENKILIESILENMSHNQTLIGGAINRQIADTFKERKIDVIDIMEREEMMILNAIPTSEGAIQIAMEEMPITLHGCNALILGYGRIGKILAKMLQGIGSNTYVEARKAADISWIEGYSYKPVYIDELDENLGKMDVIFNTIPSMILDDKALKKLKEECLIIDLASDPGGVDFEEADKMGIKTIWAKALPGKVAPLTAAQIIRSTIANVFREKEANR